MRDDGAIEHPPETWVFWASVTEDVWTEFYALIVHEALARLKAHRNHHHREYRAVWNTARSWFHLDEEHACTPFSFQIACDILDLDPEAVIHIVDTDPKYRPYNCEEHR